MLTGERPFKGASSVDVISSILRDQPSPVTEIRADLPADVGRILRRCLAKNPRDRYQTSRDVFNELRDFRRRHPRPRRDRLGKASVGHRPDAGDSGRCGRTKASGSRCCRSSTAARNAELTALAEGLTEEIVTGLSRFSYLRVIARSSTSRYANESVDVRSAGKELGARYVMEGSLRQAGTKLRLAVQLVDAASGAHLWAENFERTFSPETVFELQDDLVPRIVSTVADMYGVLTHSMSESLRGKADEELSPHEAVLRAFGYMERVTPEEHARVRRILERPSALRPIRAMPGPCWRTCTGKSMRTD